MLTRTHANTRTQTDVASETVKEKEWPSSQGNEEKRHHLEQHDLQSPAPGVPPPLTWTHGIAKYKFGSELRPRLVNKQTVRSLNVSQTSERQLFDFY